MSLKKIKTTCCIAGGGPAGMMLGFLLARGGIPVIVLEKHKDFFRDFRGDTIHPSTFNMMSELGLLQEFLKLPHQQFQEMSITIGGEPVKIASFKNLPTAHKYIGFMPQWDFLNFLAKKASVYSCFTLMMEAEVKGLVEKDGAVCGAKVHTPDGMLEIDASLVVGADGRDSVVRQAAGLKVHNSGSAVDVLWFRLSKHENGQHEPFFHIHNAQILVCFERDTYYQCGYVIRKGAAVKIKEKGLQAFRQGIAEILPMVADRVKEIKTWDDVKLLTVKIERLEKWYRHGLLCIGDAAHAMSPVGGVGINLALQDAVAAANILYPCLKDWKIIDTVHLKAVQARRQFATIITQKLQSFLQDSTMKHIISGAKIKQKPPLLFRLFMVLPFMKYLTARWFGLGIRPEHIKTPEIRN